MSALCLGVALNIRLQSLFFAPLLMVVILLPAKDRLRRWYLDCAVLLLIFLVAASPVLLLDTIQFHAPFKTGYDFWVPYFNENHLLFSVRYVPANALALWKELTLQPHGFLVAHLFGTGTYFVPAFFLLACVGLVFVPHNRFVLCAFVGGLSYSGVTLFYRFSSDTRLYLPILILLVAVAVLPVARSAKKLLGGERIVLATLTLVIFAGTCLGYPSRSGFNTTGINRMQVWEAVHFPPRLRRSNGFIAQRRFLAEFGREPGIVLSDIDPVYLNALLPASIVAAPIDAKHNYAYSRIWRYAQPEAWTLIIRGLDEGHAVYALFTSPRDLEQNKARLPALQGYEWTSAKTSDPDVTILKLNPNGG